MEKFKTKILPLKKIKANQQNPRVISESRLKKLINSLLVFPAMLSLRPIVIDDNNVILGGNMRQTALSRISQMTWDEVLAQLETLPEYNELPDAGAAVREYWEAFLNKPQAEVIYASELSESEKQQFIIKDNVSYGDWDYDELDNWDKDKLQDWGVDMLLPDGFENIEGEGEGKPQTEVKEDNFDPDAHYETKVKAGEVWQLGEHRLMCGDSTDADAVAKLMNGERADMCFTDPPYGVSYEGGLNDVKRKQIKNDALRGDSLYNFLVPVFENIKAFTIQKAAIYIFYAHSSTLQFINALYDVKLKQRSILIWKKIGGGFGDFMAQYMNAYEPCIYASNGDTVNWYGPTNEKTVWEMEKEHVCDLHPTMKPIPLVCNSIKIP